MECVSSESVWRGQEFVIRVGNRDRLLGLFDCPRCGKRHELDDAEELAGESLFCDTFSVRVPVPNKVLQRIQEEASKFRVTRLPEPDSETSLRLDLSEKRIQSEWKFRF